MLKVFIDDKYCDEIEDDGIQSERNSPIWKTVVSADGIVNRSRSMDDTGEIHIQCHSSSKLCAEPMKYHRSEGHFNLNIGDDFNTLVTAESVFMLNVATYGGVFKFKLFAGRLYGEIS